MGTPTADAAPQSRPDAQSQPTGHPPASVASRLANATPHAALTRSIAAVPLRKRLPGTADTDEDDDALDPVDAAGATPTASPGAAPTATPAPSLNPHAVEIPPQVMPTAGVATSPAELPNDWANSLADTVLALCTGSDPAFHSWTIQVPIDSAALPHTELRMTFSRHHLLLRFSTQSTQSYALISAHQSQLNRLLSRDLPGDRHIDIELT